MSDGRKVYLAYRWRGEYYRNFELTVSDAMAQGAGGWAIDELTLSIVRSRGCQFVGAWVRDDRMIYLARLDDYHDGLLSAPTRWEQRYVKFGEKGCNYITRTLDPFKRKSRRRA